MKYPILVLFIAVLWTACNSDDKIADSESYQRYGIESAVVKYSTDLMGIRSESVLYFKDYGRSETTDSKAVYMGQQSHSRQFVIDGYAYTLDMNNKSGSKMKVQNLPDSLMNPEDIDFNNIPPKIKERYRIEETGTETVLGKECTVYTMQISPTARQVMAVWENIPLKIEFTDEGIHIVTTATEINEKPNFPKGIFEVPADFKIDEFKPENQGSTTNLPT